MIENIDNTTNMIDSPRPITVGKADLEQYEREGYVLLRQILPSELLNAGRHILEAWVRQLVAAWKLEGKLSANFNALSFETGLLEAWEAAGRPSYARSPRRALVSPAMFGLLKHPVFIGIATQLLGEKALISHWAFNSRPKLPDQKFTDTPWHQDAQYYPESMRLIPTLSCWFPLVPVSATSSCLAVSPWDAERRQIFNIESNVDGSGFLGIRRSDSDNLPSVPIEMEPGDLLCFHQLVPHRAMPNKEARIRWSFDFRFQGRNTENEKQMAPGFIAHDPNHPEEETSFEEWERIWARKLLKL